MSFLLGTTLELWELLAPLLTLLFNVLIKKVQLKALVHVIVLK
jgi:hypothetical protein